MPGDTIYCPVCGEKIPSVSNFCSECGAELNLYFGADDSPAEKSAEKTKSPETTQLGDDSDTTLEPKSETHEGELDATSESNSEVDANDSDTGSDTKEESYEETTVGSIFGQLTSFVISIGVLITSILALYYFIIFILSDGIFTITSNTAVISDVTTYFFLMIMFQFIDSFLDFVWDSYPESALSLLSEKLTN